MSKARYYIWFSMILIDTFDYINAGIVVNDTCSHLQYGRDYDIHHSNTAETGVAWAGIQLHHSQTDISISSAVSDIHISVKLTGGANT
jgi:hypothetical protein